MESLDQQGSSGVTEPSRSADMTRASSSHGFAIVEPQHVIFRFGLHAERDRHRSVRDGDEISGMKRLAIKNFENQDAHSMEHRHLQTPLKIIIIDLRNRTSSYIIH